MLKKAFSWKPGILRCVYNMAFFGGSMSKRVLLFVLANILMVATLGAIFVVFSHTSMGIRLLDRSGLELKTFAIISLVVGMGGSFLSLLMSRWIAKMGVGAKVIDPSSASGEERWVLETVHKLAKQAGITTMPEVAIYPSAEVNAFATGPTKNMALVAVSVGLMNRMSHEEVEGVLGHEITHAANGDMVTLALVQGVVNAVVMFLSYILAFAISQAMRSKNERGDSMSGYFFRHMLIQVFQMVFGMAAIMLVIAPFSRWREFRADKGGAQLSGKIKMIKALEALRDAVNIKPREPQPESLAAFKIGGGVASLFSTHPPIEDRIAALKGMTFTH